jgi:hypothetical protein
MQPEACMSGLRPIEIMCQRLRWSRSRICAVLHACIIWIALGYIHVHGDHERTLADVSVPPTARRVLSTECYVCLCWLPYRQRYLSEKQRLPLKSQKWKWYGLFVPTWRSCAWSRSFGVQLFLASAGNKGINFVFSFLSFIFHKMLLLPSFQIINRFGFSRHM